MRDLPLRFERRNKDGGAEFSSVGRAPISRLTEACVRPASDTSRGALEVRCRLVGAEPQSVILR